MLRHWDGNKMGGDDVGNQVALIIGAIFGVMWLFICLVDENLMFITLFVIFIVVAQLMGTRYRKWRKK